MSQRTTHEVDGQTYEVVHGHRGDIIINTETGEKQLVEDFGRWIADQFDAPTAGDDQHTDPAGSERCPMCDEPYESYLTHLKICSVIDSESLSRS